MLLLFITQLSLLTDPTIEFSTNFSVFSDQNKFYILTPESLYIKENGSQWRRKKIENIEYAQFTSVVLNDTLYLVSEGIGRVYQLTNDVLIRRDKSFDWKSRYTANNFIKEGTIHAYGGNGLFATKNNLIYFDNTLNNWFKIKTNNANKINHFNTIAQYDSINELFYVALGKSDDLIDQEALNPKIMSYNFDSKLWEYEGEINYTPNHDYKQIANYQLPAIFDTKELVVYDFIRKKLTKFEGNFPLMENILKIHYQKASKSFIIAMAQGATQISFKIVNENEILKNKMVVLPLYKKEVDFFKPLFASGLVLVLSMVFLRYRKKSKGSTKEKLKSDKDLLIDLTEDEVKLVELLLNSYPSFVTYPELMHLLNYDLSYEAQIKRLNQAIKVLEIKLQQKLKDKSALFEIRRNMNDKRIKELRLKN